MTFAVFTPSPYPPSFYSTPALDAFDTPEPNVEPLGTQPTFQDFGPQCYNVTVTVFSPQIEGINVRGVTMSSKLNYMTISFSNETCVFSAPRTPRFHVTGT